MITRNRIRAFLFTLLLGLSAARLTDLARPIYILYTIPTPQTHSGTTIIQFQTDTFYPGPAGSGCGYEGPDQER